MRQLDDEKSIIDHLSEQTLYIHDIINLAFIIKKKLKKNELDFSSLVDPSGGYQWENFSIMLPYLPKEIVEKNLDKLLEGFMDLNWPGSRVLYGYLAEVEVQKLKKSFKRVIDYAIKTDDSDWLYFIHVFMTDHKVGMEDKFSAEIEQCVIYFKSNDIDF
ncbi:DUF5071 domain-containing protein [Acinetobacter sp. ANC 4973]|uniref:DUF5071 domain-containing protein n=1 Tax=Acinetobacter sp. ANC 4973 TaxID=1977871 RepID=UPI000A33F8BB|nr:DUF5071 domain-containing protein [Acinetobacter sp. ANC 4973]OTG96816.1 hypothetical protein B9T30_14545 [Acinetobacter sp. ANC 4973]